MKIDARIESLLMNERVQWDQGEDRCWVQGHIKVTFLAPPPALWLALSRDPTLDFLSQLSRTVSIFNKKAEQFIACTKRSKKAEQSVLNV